MKVSFFNNIKDVKNGVAMDFEQILEQIKMGIWEDIVHKIRNGKSELKRQLPYFTPNGEFSERNENGLITESGIFCVDLDKLADINDVERHLIADPYVFAFFRSASGNGLAVFFKTKLKVFDAFHALDEYFLQNYGENIDAACKDISRARFVSHDPNLYLNKSAKIFNKTPKKQNVNFVASGCVDIDFVVNQIESGRLNITSDDYLTFRNIGFAIASEFGERGRDYFIRSVQFSSKFDAQFANKQYTAFAKRKNTGIKIGTFYYHAKKAGAKLFDKETTHVIELAKNYKLKKLTKDGASESIQTLHPELNADKISKIVEFVFESREKIDTDLPAITKLTMFLKNNYEFKFNQITHNIEIDGEVASDAKWNDIWIEVNETFSEKKRIPIEDVKRCVESSKVCESYNPILDFIKKNEGYEFTDELDKIATCINTSQGFEGDDFDPDFFGYFFKKWFVSMFAFLDDDYSPLMLIFVSKDHGIGKTHFFRHLLPEDLRNFFAETDFQAKGNEDLALMHSKLLIYSDEYEPRLKVKELISKNYVSYRPLWKNNTISLKRIALFAASCNHDQILPEKKNRRIIPVEVESIDHDIYNSIDKTALFFHAYALYNSGFNWRILESDIERLNVATGTFIQVNTESELLLREFSDSEGQELLMTASEITSIISERHKGVRLSPIKMGLALRDNGFEAVEKKKNTKNKQKFWKVFAK